MAAITGLMLTAWGIADLMRTLRSKAQPRMSRRLDREGDRASSPSNVAGRRRAEVLAFLLNMNAQHGHMDVEGVRRAVKNGDPIGVGECWVCGRPRSAPSPRPQSPAYASLVPVR